jgi:tRNA-2-methylthio-N6-dimethylallyladenosine synthase
MNRLDSELVAGSLRAAGHEVVADARRADAVLYNTCSVRDHAEQKALSRVGSAGQRKAGVDGKLIIGVIGCMVQRMGEDLLKQAPQLDLICSPGRICDLPDLLAEAQTGRQVVALDPPRGAGRDEAAERRMDRLDAGRPAAAKGRTAQAFVRVMHGCDNFCTYCIVPYVRGAERSRDPRQIVDEVRRLADAGRSEITLLGQKVNSYRFAADGWTVRFSDLLARVADVPGVRRLRFVTSHPRDFTDDVLEAMRDLPNLCEYVHCPAQSGSDAVLKRMNRRYTRAEYDDLVDRARAVVPGVVLAGDFIVGFPGETEEDHLASAELIRRSGYKNCFVFKYSPRPGTSAERTLADDIPAAVKKRRNNELLAVQAEVGLAHHSAQVGREVEVLVEGPSRRSAKQVASPVPGAIQLVGRTRGDHIVVFDGPKTLAGRYVTLTITDANSLTLFGALGAE